MSSSESRGIVLFFSGSEVDEVEGPPHLLLIDDLGSVLGISRAEQELPVLLAVADDEAPVAVVADLRGVAGPSCSMKVEGADDRSGIVRVVVTIDRGGVWQSYDLTYDPSLDRWTGEIDGLTGRVNYFVQVVDSAGNIALSENKGAFFEPIDYSAYLPIVLKNK